MAGGGGDLPSEKVGSAGRLRRGCGRPAITGASSCATGLKMCLSLGYNFRLRQKNNPATANAGLASYPASFMVPAGNYPNPCTGLGGLWGSGLGVRRPGIAVQGLGFTCG